jgi:excisionase family DNA binding protein
VSDVLVQIPAQKSGRISILQIAARLSIGRMAVYKMLERGIIPAIRLDRQWIVTRQAFDEWERTCGQKELPAIPGTVH